MLYCNEIKYRKQEVLFNVQRSTKSKYFININDKQYRLECFQFTVMSAAMTVAEACNKNYQESLSVTRNTIRGRATTEQRTTRKR